VSAFVGNIAIAVPVAIYLGGLWLVRDQFNLPFRDAAILPLAAGASLVTPFLPFSTVVLAGIVAFAAVLRAARSPAPTRQE
jgi:hypothetical protein